ncbi:MAG: recombination protein RecR [Firmicutes bacterium HGW-Firmicutes-21]|nr:MAG: recombination protein RecR [Firmicutes bacterium HGW-Firmicutes-21]
MTPTLERLINHFSALPGVGRKSAARLAYHVLGMKESDVRSFADCLLSVKNAICLCNSCQSFCERDTCDICADSNRDRTIICVVEDAKAIDSIENLHEYKGLYHVLHGVISPIDGIGPEQLKLKELLARIDDNTKEVIIATNPSVEGEATALYISRILKPLGVKVTRLAYGLPVGATLEYADGMTLLRAIEGRTEV